jgi:hypothetical protein
LGVLSDAQCSALVELLARHTSTPDTCWFCVWNGYGTFNPSSMTEVRAYTGAFRGIRAWWWRVQPRHDSTAKASRVIRIAVSSSVVGKGP